MKEGRGETEGGREYPGGMNGRGKTGEEPNLRRGNAWKCWQQVFQGHCCFPCVSGWVGGLEGLLQLYKTRPVTTFPKSTVTLLLS